jgi:hypothetical protein
MCFDAFTDHQNQVLQNLFFHVWRGEKRVLMLLRILPDYQNHVPKKCIFLRLEWLKTCFYAFPDHQNQVLKILFFYVSSGKKRVFMHFQTTRIKSLKFYFFTSGVVKNMFYAFPDHQNQFLKKVFFYRLEWLKMCFYAFAHTSRPPEILKKIFFNVWRGKKRVFMHFQTTRIKSLKFYFFTSGVVKNVFLCISRPPDSIP